MTVRIKLLIAVIAAFAAAEGYMHEVAAPTCDSSSAQEQLYDVLHEQFHLHNIFVNSVSTVSGGWFYRSQECVAQETEIRGNVDATGMPWQEVKYRVERPRIMGPATVTAELGDQVPLADPEPSFWARLMAYF